MDGAVTIREFAWDDYPAVVALWTAVLGGIKPEDERPRLADTLARNPGLFLVAEEAGQVVGTVLGTFDGRRGYLYHVAVAPACQRRGIAGALLAEVEARLWVLGAQKLHLRTHRENAGAIAFYRSIGWEPDGPVAALRKARTGAWTPDG
jgi:ribosomal protein S18 acetylase RimI-like enzyme